RTFLPILVRKDKPKTAAQVRLTVTAQAKINATLAPKLAATAQFRDNWRPALGARLETVFKPETNQLAQPPAGRAITLRAAGIDKYDVVIKATFTNPSAAAVGAWGFDRVAGAASGPVLPLRGLAFYGGLLAALVAVAALAPVLGLPMRRLFDAGAPPIALGHAVGRIGCGVAGCCYGRRVDPHGALHAIGLARVPTQWLESAALGAIALWLARTRPAREGAVIARYFASYAVVRIALETLRDDPRGALPWLPAWLSPSQWVSVGLLVAAGALTATRARAAA
ncbi:MAG: prolipoprotein diacylglyceryl transferase family protein, partial [Deltaproteobacteria bacterium]